MKKILLSAVLALYFAAAVPAQEVSGNDWDIIIRAAATSFPEAGLGAKTAICAVVLNRMEAEGFGETAADVISAENSGFDASLLCAETDQKNLRMARDACIAAMEGADPTGGLLYFEKLPEPGAGDNRIEFAENMDLEKYRAVIGGYGFW